MLSPQIPQEYRFQDNLKLFIRIPQRNGKEVTLEMVPHVKFMDGARHVCNRVACINPNIFTASVLKFNRLASTTIILVNV